MNPGTDGTRPRVEPLLVIEENAIYLTDDLEAVLGRIGWLRVSPMLRRCAAKRVLGSHLIDVLVLNAVKRGADGDGDMDGPLPQSRPGTGRGASVGGRGRGGGKPRKN